MQMDSYYSFQDDSHFFAGAGIPGSPDLPLADLIASLSEPLPAPASQSAFQDYRTTAGTRGGGRNGNVNIHRRMMSVLGRMAPGSGEDEEELDLDSDLVLLMAYVHGGGSNWFWSP
jgi:hypothetical protein